MVNFYDPQARESTKEKLRDFALLAEAESRPPVPYIGAASSFANRARADATVHIDFVWRNIE